MSAPNRGFNLLERKVSFGQSVRESLLEKAAQRKIKSGSKGDLPSQIRPMIPIPELPLAWMFSMEGFVSRSVISVIGQDRVGKTSLVFTIAGWALRHNIPVCYVETESKPMFPDRIKRCLHPKPELAQAMYNTINFEQAFTLKDMINQVEDWVRLIRKPTNKDTFVPMEIPVMVVVDSLSKLMPPKEAQGRSDQVDMSEDAVTAKDKKARAKAQRQEIDQGSNQEMSKYMHKWTRLMPEFLSHYNVFMILVEHQNQKLEMDGGGGFGNSFIPQFYKDLENRTKIGGNAINQNATYQIVMVPHRVDQILVRGKPEVSGNFCKMKVVKSSHSSSHKMLTYRVMMMPLHDQEGWMEPVINFDPDLGDILIRSGVLNIRAGGRQGAFHCQEFGGQEMSYRELASAYYAHPELHEKVQKGLGLRGAKDNLQAPTINPVLLPAGAEVVTPPAPPPPLEDPKTPAPPPALKTKAKAVNGKKVKVVTPKVVAPKVEAPKAPAPAPVVTPPPPVNKPTVFSFSGGKK